jgi:hypothetical protein
MLGSWRGQLGNLHALKIWSLVPLCLMWCLWLFPCILLVYLGAPRAFINKVFSLIKKKKRLLEIKKMKLQSLYTWRVAWNSLPVSNFFEFFELCSFSLILEFSCILPVF